MRTDPFLPLSEQLCQLVAEAKRRAPEAKQREAEQKKRRTTAKAGTEDSPKHKRYVLDPKSVNATIFALASFRSLLGLLVLSKIEVAPAG